MIKGKILKQIRDCDMLSSSRRITVALSGGADSVALLYALHGLQNELGITVSAAHLNHMIRGAEADRDEDFVRSLCESLKIPLTVEREDVPALAKKTGQSLELAARQARYGFFESKIPDGLIATAHTASDQLETVLLNLTRGTGPDGLCGIPAVRGRIIRPLLSCTRAEIEDYCRENGLRFVTDSTNLSDDYTRNRLRHLVIPQLKEINPAVETAAARCAKFCSEEREYLDRIANGILKSALRGGALDITALKELDRAAAKRVLRLFAAQFYTDNDAFHTEKLLELCKSGGKCSLPNGLYGICRDNTLTITDGKVKKVRFITEISEENTDFSKDTKKIHNLLLNNALDYDKIVGKLIVRSRLPGDKLRLRKSGCTKTLKKLYNEFSVPLDERENLPVVCDDCGIVWIYSIGTAERCAVTLKTKRIARFSVIKQDF